MSIYDFNKVTSHVWLSYDKFNFLINYIFLDFKMVK
jgi:hypothetical protein